MSILTAFDHAILLVDDLDAGEAMIRRLGFNPTPRGYHSAALGTANATIVLPDRRTYFEVLAIIEPTPANAGKRAFLEASGPALYGLAFKTEDARVTAAGLAEAGLGDGRAVDFVRPVELPGGTRDAAFAVAGTRDGALPGAWIFACQHKTPDVVWRDDHLEQPNGALGVRAVLGVARDLDGLAARWAIPFAGRVDRTGDRVAVRTDTALIEFLAPEALAARLGGVVRHADGPALAALVFASSDLARTARHLASAGVAVVAQEGRLIVGPQAGCGATFVFEQAS